MNELQALLDEF